MAATPSTMLALGTKAPDFTLPDTEERMVSLKDFPGKKAYCIIFMCNHCPYVKHIAPKLAEVARRYGEQGVQFFGINSNDTSRYPDDDLSHMREERKKQGYAFPYLLDETQAVAKAYAAACTPDIYVFNNKLELKYRGQFDDSRPGNGKPVDGKSLTNALEQLIAGKEPSGEQKASIGCNIKWRPGNEPGYFVTSSK